MTVPIRRRARELAMQVLYQCETSGQTVEEAFELLRENFQANKKAAPYALEILAGVVANRAEIDGLISAHSKNWRLERMAMVDRNILRIAAFEFLRKGEDVPASVVINEALEVAARYSDEDASPFINGVLDSMKTALGRE
ncbi:MAG: transcription antitermination factor NusB [Desulfurivibrionaceae bacterium]|nr:transcription antitermination factor NusB [Desulfobulbales bacterium]MDT8335147.1 transcription antitermination factor NusB [Desulfurivibrionaceae bacterium]